MALYAGVSSPLKVTIRNHSVSAGQPIGAVFSLVMYAYVGFVGISLPTLSIDVGAGQELVKEVLFPIPEGTAGMEMTATAVLLDSLGQRLAERLITAPVQAARPTITSPSPGVTEIYYDYVPEPTAIVTDIVLAAPETTAVVVLSPLGSFTVDSASTQSAAEISGMTYTDWLNLYAFGISPSGISGIAFTWPASGKKLIGQVAGTGVWI